MSEKRHVRILVIIFILGTIAVSASLVLANGVDVFCANTANEGKSCSSSSGVSPSACYKGLCLTTSEISYKATLEDCKGKNTRGLCVEAQAIEIQKEIRSPVNPNYISESATYSCKPKAVDASCTAASCYGPGLSYLGEIPDGCIGTAASCVAEKDGSGKIIIDPILGTQTVCRYAPAPDKDKDNHPLCAGIGPPLDCTEACCGTKGCSPPSCPDDCDDNDPYDSTIRLADIEKVEVVMDTDYKKETKDKRKFTPQLPVTPFDNFNIIATVKKKCGIKSTAQMPILPISLITLDAAGKEVVSASSSLTPIDTTTYQWKLVGWPDGLTTNDEIMEILIDSIASKRKIFTRITGAYPDEKPKETPIVMSNCVQMYRDGNHKVVTMRGKSASFAPSFLFKFANITFAEGFEIIEPFKSNIDSFSSYVDLVNHDDTKWAMLIPDTLYNLWNRPKKISSCGADGSQYFFINGRTYEGISLYKIRVVYLLTSSLDAQIAMHETGHSFCGLLDEYLGSPFERIFYPEGLNCPVSPRNNYYYNGKLYGDAFWKGCTRDSVFRPSKNSLMNQGAKHSVIDCGYCMSAIKGGSVREHWPECMKLDTIKPDCKAGSCPGKLFCSPKALQDDPACAHPNAFVCNSATGLCEYT